MAYSKTIQLQYEGFLNTPFLWMKDAIKKVPQFSTNKQETSVFNNIIEKNPRLGKLVERFVSHELQQNKSIDILVENIQIQDDKITIGELDCLLLHNNVPIHLEIIYKFYLYDANVSNLEIERWIGPNRRDSFVEKLDKLIHKQLPLLYHPKTKPLLDAFNLVAENIEQKVYFKAQLFVPLKDYGKIFTHINNKCVVGFYIHINEISLFTDCKFHMPTKHNWLVIPHTNVAWLHAKDFKKTVAVFMNEQRAPLCWLKKPNGELFKLFVVWW